MSSSIPPAGRGFVSSIRSSSPIAALAAAAGVLAILAVQLFASLIVSTVTSLASPSSGGLDDILYRWMFALRSIFLVILPFVAGVFVSLWAIAPIIRLRGVLSAIVRALLATAIGAAGILVIAVGSALLSVLGAIRPFGGGPSPARLAGSMWSAVVDSLGSALSSGITYAPVVVLVVVLLWVLLRRRSL